MLLFITKINSIIQYYFYFFYVYLAYYLGLLDTKRPPSILDKDNEYTAPLKAKFLQTFTETNIDYNENVDAIFYDKKKLGEYMMESNTELERIWKTRILMEITPRGNIVMFYDAFKMGFSYFCDQKTISYDLLNAAAMKYVRLYRCRDFFIDESILPEDSTSPLIKIHFTEDAKKNKNQTTAFAHMKNYGKENPNAKQSYQTRSTIYGIKTVAIPAKPVNSKEQMMNKFLYLGKMNNYKCLQSVPKKRKVLANFTSPLLESIIMDSGVQREALSYKDFKAAAISKN